MLCFIFYYYFLLLIGGVCASDDGADEVSKLQFSVFKKAVPCSVSNIIDIIINNDCRN